MVSLQELITQRKTELSSIESQLQRQQESISEGEIRLGQEERIFLEQTTPLPLTLGRQASLARVVGIGEVARAVRITRREKRKARREARPKFQEARVEIEEARAEVEEASTSLDPVRRQIRNAENFLIGRKLALAGRSEARLRGRQQKRGFRAGVAELGVFDRRETLTVTELPPKPLGPVGSTGEIKTFGQPEKFARSFREATGQTSFTIAVPIRKQAGKIFVQDFNFQFEDGKLVRSKPTGSALITEEQFLTADLRRRRRNPEFTFGSTARFQTEPQISEPRSGFFRRAGEAFFGPGSEQFLGIGGLPSPLGLPQIGVARPAITFRQIRETITRTPVDITGRQLIPVLGVPGLLGLPRVGEFAGLGIRGAATLIPTTPGEALVLGGAAAATILGPPKLLATSQRGLFRPGVDIPIERAFFVTPAEPTLGIPETRVSRLGLIDFFRFPTTAVEIGFGIPPAPQIGITRGTVARTEARGAFAIGRGGELEAIRTTGLIRRPGRIPRTDLISTRPITRISGEALISTALARTARLAPTTGILGVTTLGVSSLRLGTTTLLPITTTLPSTGLISPAISPLISPPVSPGISPLISPPITPTTLITPTVIPSTALFPEEPTPARRRRRARGGVAAFDTFVKAKGKFTKVNIKPQRLENALSLGADLVDNSTSRQFKVRRSGRIRKPKRINPFFEANRFKFREFRQRGKERALTPLNFIERTNFAIDTPNEVQGIPLAGVLEQRRRRAAGIKPKRRKRRTARSPRRNLSFTDL